MADMEKFTIEKEQAKYILTKGQQEIFLTKKEIVNALADLSDSDVLFEDVQLRKVEKEKKKEQCEQLKPIGFDHAPEKAKKYRRELEENVIYGNWDAIDEMKQWKEIIVYNEDKTIRLPTIDETLCTDLAWWESMNWNDAMELAKSQWYHLLSEWTDYDSEANKQSTEGYKLENIFWKCALEYMLGLDRGRYWTSTICKYRNWVEDENVAYYRSTDTKNQLSRGLYNKRASYLVCGFKNKAT